MKQIRKSRKIKAKKELSKVYLAVQNSGMAGWSLHEYVNTQLLLADVQEGSIVCGCRWKVLKELSIGVTMKGNNKR